MEMLGKDRIDYLVGKAVYIMREARNQFKNPAMLWAGGKDSTTMVYIAKHLAFPDDYMFPVLFIDTTKQFRETYNFMKMIKNAWNLDLRILRNDEALAKGMNPKDHAPQECCYYLKTKPLNDAVKNEGYDALLVGIRWDEEAMRSQENPFSYRRLPEHTRVHPMLTFSETDIWATIKKYDIAYNPLYDYVIDGKKYRSIGCWPCTEPTYDIEAERDGRIQTKEKVMEDLRALGYL